MVSVTHSAWAHPRSCGENIRPMGFASIAAGSSPLTRGKPLDHGLQGFVDGIIPAHAGKTNARRGMKYRGAAHPRSRGENQSRVRRHTPPPGSSPLTRGKQSEGTGAFTHHGLIPAHAGKTAAHSIPAPIRTAHPHSCGENGTLAVQDLCATGSSPLMRGKRRHNPATTAVVGFIPAHAGKTLTDKHPVRTVTAHPRSRGENVMRFFAPSAVQGSSPLTRGKLSLLGVVLRSVGLIPAHAGKTLITSAANSTVRAHPRSRGENEARGVAWHPSEGSSPLTRGKRW